MEGGVIKFPYCMLRKSGHNEPSSPKTKLCSLVSQKDLLFRFKSGVVVLVRQWYACCDLAFRIGKLDLTEVGEEE